MKIQHIIKLIIVAAFILIGTQTSKACHALATTNFTLTPVGTGMQVNANSQSPTCGCDEYWLDIEVRCTNIAFDGAPFDPTQYLGLNTYPYFQSAQMLKPSCVVQAYPSTTIPYSSLCPGVEYKVRVRENNNGNAGPWSTEITFIAPGTIDPLIIGVTATETSVCPGDCTTLTANVTGGCGLQPQYTWSNGATTQSITVCPGSTTTYSVDVYEICTELTATASITITVGGIISMTCPPGLTAVCDISEQPPYPDYNAFQAAGGSVTLDPSATLDVPTFNLVSEVSNNQSCPETVTRTYEIADDCGVFVNCTQTIVINDLVAPTAPNPPPINVQCASNVPLPNASVVTGESDNCAAAPTVAFLNDATDNGSCPETITRTYRVTDACGNYTDVTQTITINDDINPTGSAPIDQTVSCFGDVPVVNINDVTGVSDNCTATPTVTHVGDVNSGGACPFDIIRTYRIEDECGNFTDVQQTITVNDNVNPTGTAPGPVSVQCIGDIPAVNTNDVTGVNDNCTATPTVTHIGDATNGLSCPETITRTYRITDDCGNFIEVDQIITVNDDIDPTASAPAPVAVQCAADIPVIDETVVDDELDNCTATPIVSHVGDATDGLSCPETITRTYRVEDACGNFIEVDQIITVNDDIAPTASNPATTTVECATDVPAVDETVINDEADNCTAAPTVTFLSEVSDNNVCDGEQIVRTYQIEDDCGNTTTVTHTIIIDSYTPTFTLAGTDPTVCGGTDGFITISGLDPNTDYSFSYNGGATSVITTDGAGEYVITGLGAGSYTGFTVSDADCPACSTTDGATITLTDPNPPAIDAGVNVQVCEGDQVTLTANNPDGATITWDNGITDGTAFTPAVGTTTYTVTANLAGCINSDAVNVTVAPTIDDLTCPGGLTAVCDITEQPAYADFYAFIADGGSATIPAGGVIDTASFVMLSEVSDGNTCPETVTRTYQIADTCGVTVTCTQTIVINDLINPTASAPAPVSVQCIGDVPAIDETVVNDEADNCTAAPAVTHVGDASDGNTCPETITRTYRITDDCGNFIEVDQIITVNDDIDPTASAPAPVAVQCIGDVPVEDVTVITDEADNCTAAPAVTHVGDVSDGNTCPEVITRTYRIEDACGNFIEVDQIITVNDDIAPTASNPATTTVLCATDVPAVDETVVTDEADNCTVAPTVTFISETSDNNVCNGEELTRVYEIADDCGNTTTVTHTIIIDSYTPTFTVAGTDPTLCGANDGFITITGLNPNESYDISYNGNAAQTVNTDANGEYVITGLTAGSYTDFTINLSSCPPCQEVDNTNINLVDPNAPPVDAGVDQTVCDGTDVTLTANNPNGANISWDNGVTDGTPFTPGVGTINYTVTAEEAGCISTDLVVVTVNPIPNVNAGNDISICDGEQVTLSGSGADSYTWDNGVNNGVSFIPTATTTYTVTGTSLGCTATDEVLVTVFDNPDVTFTADNMVGCIPQEVSFSNTTGPNSATCEWNIGGTVITDNCDPTYTFTNAGCFDITLTVTSNDGCTSTHTEQNYICIDDYPIADFSANPSELTSIYNQTDMDNSSVGASTYEWDFGDGNGSTETNPSHTYPGEEENEFLVQLIATSQYGCKDTAYQTVLMREELLYFVPNTFTPDNDNFNETFKPVFTSGFDPQKYTLLVFNRWGETIFESNDASIGWDGTYGENRDELVSDGTYVWKIIFKTKYKDERVVEVGHVNVLK